MAGICDRGSADFGNESVEVPDDETQEPMMHFYARLLRDDPRPELSRTPGLR
jgi:hypothetical protein